MTPAALHNLSWCSRACHLQLVVACSLSLGLVFPPHFGDSVRLTLGICAFHHHPARRVLQHSFTDFEFVLNTSISSPLLLRPSSASSPIPASTPPRGRRTTLNSHLWLHLSLIPGHSSLGPHQRRRIAAKPLARVSPSSVESYRITSCSPQPTALSSGSAGTSSAVAHKPARFPPQLASGKPLRRRHPLLPLLQTRGFSPRPALTQRLRLL